MPTDLLKCSRRLLHQFSICLHSLSRSHRLPARRSLAENLSPLRRPLTRQHCTVLQRRLGGHSAGSLASFLNRRHVVCRRTYLLSTCLLFLLMSFSSCVNKSYAKSSASSVLPPPPRYPSQAAYNQAVANGQAAPMIETNNILSHPAGPEYQLVVGEGTVCP